MAEEIVWNQASTRRFKEALSSRSRRASAIIDLLATRPGKKYGATDLITAFDLPGEGVLNGLLGEWTKAAKQVGLPQNTIHSWFVQWQDHPSFLYWLTQERADWWTGHRERQFWALCANPSIYDIRTAVREVEVDWWVTRGSDLAVGDRFLVWQTLGGGSNRGIVALGEVTGEPVVRPDAANPYWVAQGQGERAEERVPVQYLLPPGVPLWLDVDTDDVIASLSVARARGGTVFTVTPRQWEAVLETLGGWDQDRAAGRGTPWTKQEVTEVVADYMTMLRAELAGEHYVKARHRRTLQERLLSRSEGAIERKHQNISAVLLDMGFPFIDGYKPLANYQAILRDEVARRLRGTDELLTAAIGVADRFPETVPEIKDVEQVVSAPPERRRTVEDGPRPDPTLPPRQFDYQARELRNRQLGRRGEEFVLKFERKRLASLGLPDLANEIEWVAQTQGDGAGYDIASFDETGEPIYIEVKTTNLGRNFPFYISANEVRVSEDKGNRFRLYRVFDFSGNPRLFILKGPVADNCRLTPSNYRASF